MDEKEIAEKYGKKKKNRKLKLLIAALIILLAVLLVLNWRTIMSPFKDIALNLGEGGFPVMLPGSTDYCLGEMGDNFYLLTDTYLYTYNAEGAEIQGVQHGFQNPVSDAGDSRLLVYDKNGKAFRVYSKSSEIYSLETEDSIVFARSGDRNKTAVVTTSSRYSNYLYIFGGDGKQIFRFASPDEKIMQVCFSGGNNIYVAVVGESGGELKSSVLCFDTTNENGEVWRTPVGNKVVLSLEKCPDGVYTVTSGGFYLMDEATGELKAQNTFTKQIVGIGGSGGELRVLFFHDSASNGQTAAVYNSSLEAVAGITFENMDDFDTYQNRLYVLSGKNLTVYNSSLEEIKKFELEDEYSDLEIINGNAYLLGYNTVQYLSLGI